MRRSVRSGTVMFIAAATLLFACGSDTKDAAVPTTTGPAATAPATVAGTAESSAATTTAATTPGPTTSAPTATGATKATATTAAPTTAALTSAAAMTTASTTASTTAAKIAANPATCVAGKTLTAGKFTVATGNPAYSPYVVDDKPESGKGFESAVTYAVAAKMGFKNADVVWLRTGFDEAIAPGPKSFDANIQQFSATPDRAKVVDFSLPYYTTNQALVTTKTSKFAKPKSMTDLKTAKLGAATGTTSLTFITGVIKPTSAPQVFDDNAGAAQALQNNQIDGLIVDLPTAYGIVNGGGMTDGNLAGQFQRLSTEPGDQLAYLITKGSPLTECINGALKQLTDDGTLARLATTWLAQGTDGVPIVPRG